MSAERAARVAADARRGEAHFAQPWRWSVERRTLAVVLPHRYNVLGWAPLRGGLRRANVILNHQIALNDRAATEAPRIYLSRLARSLGYETRGVVAMMTGADIARLGTATVYRGGLTVSAWCSAGCSNALRVGDRATSEAAAPGTINLIVTLNRTLDPAALAEAIQIAVEARVVAVLKAGIISMRSHRPATGTGTDCVVIAAPAAVAATGGARSDPIVYCGKHTVAGELIGRAVLRSCADALARRAP